MTIDIIYYQFRVYVTIEHISSLDLGVYLAGQVMKMKFVFVLWAASPGDS